MGRGVDPEKFEVDTGPKSLKPEEPLEFILHKTLAASLPEKELKAVLVSLLAEEDGS